MKILDITQKSKEWFSARRGIPTASRFDSIITPGKGEPSKGQDTLISELIAEALSPTYAEADGYQSADMLIGTQLEPEARRFYQFALSVEPVREVGFVLSDCGRFGASPDSLVGEAGVLEIKCPSLAVHVGYLRGGVLPEKYRVQCHGELAVMGRDWLDFLSYCPGLPHFLVRVTPDVFTEKLAKEVSAFCDRLNVERQRFGLPPLGNKEAA